jgi:hypothetical protein
MQNGNRIQVLPASDNATYYLAMQPFSAGNTNAEYASPNLTFNPATGAINSVNPLSVSSNLTINGALTVASTMQLGSYGSINALFENATIIGSAPSAFQNFDVMTQSVVFFTANSLNNFILNIRGNSSTKLDTIMPISSSCTIAIFVTNSGTAYYPNTIQIDGVPLSARWVNGSLISSGNINSVDIYSFNIIKTRNATFSLFASQTKFA